MPYLFLELRFCKITAVNFCASKILKFPFTVACLSPGYLVTLQLM
jgi:hypothetical protein